VELHETVAALHGIAADLVERSDGIEARLSVRAPCTRFENHSPIPAHLPNHSHGTAD